jgi:hypothetical protein
MFGSHIVDILMHVELKYTYLITYRELCLESIFITDRLGRVQIHEFLDLAPFMYGAHIQHRLAVCRMLIHAFQHLQGFMFPGLIHHRLYVKRQKRLFF